MSKPLTILLSSFLSLSLVDVSAHNADWRSEIEYHVKKPRGEDFGQSRLISQVKQAYIMRRKSLSQPMKPVNLRSWLDLSSLGRDAQPQKLVQNLNHGVKTELDNTNSTQEAKKEEQEKKSRDEEDKVRLGIIGASEKDRSSEIWRCPDIPHIDPSKMSQPNVSVGMYILNLHAEDRGLSTGVFFADFLLFLRQKDKPLTEFEGTHPMNELAFTNAMSIDSISKYGTGVRRVAGKFFFSPDLRWYPFDKQFLEIVLEQFRSPVSVWVFVPDADLNGMSPSIRFPGWQTSLRQSPHSHFANCRAKVSTKVYPGASSDKQSSSSNITFSRFTFSIAVQRPIYEGIITKFVPPFVMLAPTLYSFWLDPTVNWPIRITMGSGGLISIVFFHSSISSQLLSNFAVIVLFRQEAEYKEEVSPLLKTTLCKVSIWSGFVLFFGLFGIILPLWILSIYADAKAAAQGYVNLNFANS
eukprot:762500-Hanusia_phi.AAC.4